MSQVFPVQISVSVRERDCLWDGTLDEGVLLQIFREARRAYISRLNAHDESFHYRLWDARIKILGAMGIDDRLDIGVACDELGDQAFRLRCSAYQSATGELVAEGSSLQVLVDQGGHDRVIPDIFRQRVAALEGREFPLPS